MLNITRTFVFYILLLISTASHGLTMDECNYVSSELNKEYPARISANTFVVGTVCIASKQIYLVYYMRVNYPKSQFQINSFKQLRRDQINSWCTAPQQRKLLSQVGIKYVYHDNANTYIGETAFTIKDCSR